MPTWVRYGYHVIYEKRIYFQRILDFGISPRGLCSWTVGAEEHDYIPAGCSGVPEAISLRRDALAPWDHPEPLWWQWTTLEEEQKGKNLLRGISMWHDAKQEASQ